MDAVDKNNTLKSRTLKGIAWMTLSSVGKLVVQLLFMAVLARLLGPEVYGVQAIAMVLISFAQLISDGGLGKSIIQKQTTSETQISTVFYCSIIIGCILSGVIILFSENVSEFFENDELSEVLRVLSLIFIIKGFSVVAESLAIKNMDFKPVALRGFLSYLISYALIAIPLAFLGWGVWALVFATITQELIKSILILSLVPHSKNSRLFNIGQIKELFKYGGWLTLAGLFNKIATNADTLIVGKLLSINSLGIYSRGYKLMHLPAGLFGSVISTTLFPALSSIQNNIKRTRSVHYKLIALVAGLMLPFSIFMYFVADDVVLILLGNEWRDVGPVLKILALGIYFRIGYKIHGEVIKSNGKVLQLTSAQIIYAISISIGCYLGHFDGVLGIATGVLFALVFHYVVMMYLGARITNLGIREILSAHYMAITTTACLYVALYFVYAYFPRTPNYSFTRIVVSVTCLVSIIFIFTILFRERTEVIWVISIAKGKLGKNV